MTLPPMLYIDDLRKLMPHRDAQWIRRFLKSNGIAAKDPSGNIYTTDVQLEGAFPDDGIRALTRRWADIEAGKTTTASPYDFDDLDADADE